MYMWLHDVDIDSLLAYFGPRRSKCKINIDDSDLPSQAPRPHLSSVAWQVKHKSMPTPIDLL